MPTSSPFVANTTSQQVVTLVPMQPTILNPLVLSVPVTHLVQLTVSKNVTVSSSIPPVSGQAMPLPWGQNLSVSMLSGTTNVSSS